MPTDRKPRRRKACDRCHSQKLRCVQLLDTASTCRRCHKAGRGCTFSEPSRIGRPRRIQQTNAPWLETVWNLDETSGRPESMAEETVHEIPVEVNGFDEAFRTDEFIFMRPLEPISGLYSEEQLATLNETSLSENEVSNFTSSLGNSPPFMPNYSTLMPQPWWIESLVETELGLFHSAVDNREQLPTGLNKELHPQHWDERMQK